MVEGAGSYHPDPLRVMSDYEKTKEGLPLHRFPDAGRNPDAWFMRIRQTPLLTARSPFPSLVPRRKTLVRRIVIHILRANPALDYSIAVDRRRLVNTAHLTWRYGCFEALGRRCHRQILSTWSILAVKNITSRIPSYARSASKLGALNCMLGGR